MRPNKRSTQECQGQFVPRDKKLSPLEKLWTIQGIIRKSRLDPFGRVVLEDIWDKSIAWDNPEAFVGVDGIAERCCMSRSSVQRTLKKLTRMGIISVRRTRSANAYRINVDKIGAQDMNLGSKGHEAAAKKSAEGVSEGLSGGITQTPNEGKNNLPREEQESRPPAAPTPEAPHVASLEKYRLKHFDERVTGRTLAQTWRAAWGRSWMQEISPARPLTPKETKQLRLLLQRWDWSPRELHFFLTWVILDYEAILRRMSWMTDPPERPGTGWVLAMSEQLTSLWFERVRHGFVNDLSKDNLARLMASGLTPKSTPEPRKATKKRRQR